MPKTLLVADDSLTIRKVIGMVLALEDFQITSVDNGIDAIARAREMRPDLVIADVLMPGRSGYEVCETLKSDPATASTPVLLLAGNFEPFDEARAWAAGPTPTSPSLSRARPSSTGSACWSGSRGSADDAGPPGGRGSAPTTSQPAVPRPSQPMASARRAPRRRAPSPRPARPVRRPPPACPSPCPDPPASPVPPAPRRRRCRAWPARRRSP
jgi:CheY-like chemotaxis protein